MTELLILGLLDQKQMSGYDIQIALETSHAQSWGNVRVGSIYYALNQMEKKKIIKVVSFQLTGKRRKSTYEITPEGRKYFLDSIDDNLRTVTSTYPVNLYSALNYADEIGTEKVKKSLNARKKCIEGKLDLLSTEKSEKEKYFSGNLPPLSELVFSHMRETLDSELKLINSILELY